MLGERVILPGEMYEYLCTVSHRLEETRAFVALGRAKGFVCKIRNHDFKRGFKSLSQ